jgi:hypothetical protein
MQLKKFLDETSVESDTTEKEYFECEPTTAATLQSVSKKPFENPQDSHQCLK